METRLTNKFQAVPMFAQYYGEYYIDIGDEDWKLLELFFSKEHRVANSPNADGYGTPVTTYDEWFQILYLNQNLICVDERFANIKSAIQQAAHHYLEECVQFDMPKEIYMDIADSWFIRLAGDKEKPKEFQPHNHSFAMLSCVLYLHDSNNGLEFTNNDQLNMFEPFTWPVKEANEINGASQYVRPKKGKLVIFPGRMHHRLVNSHMEEDVRWSIVANIWPQGLVSNNHAAGLVSGSQRHERAKT